MHGVILRRRALATSALDSDWFFYLIQKIKKSPRRSRGARALRAVPMDLSVNHKVIGNRGELLSESLTVELNALLNLGGSRLRRCVPGVYVKPTCTERSFAACARATSALDSGRFFLLRGKTYPGSRTRVSDGSGKPTATGRRWVGARTCNRQRDPEA